MLRKLEPKLLIAEAGRTALLEEALSVPILIVGEVPEGHKSFLDEMRASPSSLAKSLVAASSPAVAVATNNDILSFSHEQIFGALAGSPIILRFEEWDLGAAIAQFGRSAEAVIG